MSKKKKESKKKEERVERVYEKEKGHRGIKKEGVRDKMAW